MPRDLMSWAPPGLRTPEIGGTSRSHALKYLRACLHYNNGGTRKKPAAGKSAASTSGGSCAKQSLGGRQGPEAGPETPRWARLTNPAPREGNRRRARRRAGFGRQPALGACATASRRSRPRQASLPPTRAVTATPLLRRHPARARCHLSPLRERRVADEAEAGVSAAR